MALKLGASIDQIAQYKDDLGEMPRWPAQKYLNPDQYETSEQHPRLEFKNKVNLVSQYRLQTEHKKNRRDQKVSERKKRNRRSR